MKFLSRNFGLRCIAAVIGVGAMVATAPSSRAYVYSSSYQWASWSSAPYTIYNDVWGSSSGVAVA